jgi:hypothetical protein
MEFDEELPDYEMVKLENTDREMSRSLFLKFEGKTISEESGKSAIQGERIVKGVIVRFKDGYIHGGTDSDGFPQAAIECRDQHKEWWENGRLHHESGPAVISDFGDWEEYWNQGELVSIYQRGTGPRVSDKEENHI